MISKSILDLVHTSRTVHQNAVYVSSLLEPIENESNVKFDINADGKIDKTGWIHPTTGLLAIDHNKDNIIQDASELFGEFTATPKLIGNHQFSNGYEALQAYDSNKDGFIDMSDRLGLDILFDYLGVWFDRNINGKTDKGEFLSLSSLGITKIATSYTATEIPYVSFKNHVRFQSKFYGPKACPASGCHSYDVFFATDTKQKILGQK